jgi:toxin ParE1/3/4
VRRKPVVPREQANRDVDEAVSHYLTQANPAVALGFIDALEKAYSHIARHPATGSPRYAHELNLPGLRAWLHWQESQPRLAPSGCPLFRSLSLRL